MKHFNVKRLKDMLYNPVIVFTTFSFFAENISDNLGDRVLYVSFAKLVSPMASAKDLWRQLRSHLSILPPRFALSLAHYFFYNNLERE
jgi:hypothetical protein